jgi:hypothetical protein
LASVEYTIPQSADPWATWFNTAVTSVPKDSTLNISSFDDLKNINGTIAIGDP